MTKILIDSGSFESKGWVAIIIGLRNVINRCVPDAEIFIFSHDPERDREFCKKYGLKLIRSPWIWTGVQKNNSTVIYYGIVAFLDLIFSLIISSINKLGIRIRRPIDDFDLVIHYNPDWYSDAERGTWKTIYPLMRLFILRTILKRALYATLPSSMGPFKNKSTSIIGHSVLNGLDLVALRIEDSYDAICSLHLSKPQVSLVNDLAFLCDPISIEDVESIFKIENIRIGEKTLVGFCPSRGPIGHAFEGSMDRCARYRNYIECIANIIDYVVEKLDANLVLISHHDGDVNLCQQIYDSVIQKQSVAYFRNEYNADELKGVIGHFDMFIGSLMHSTIASTSMGVPTIAIAYANKFYGIIGNVMGQEDYIIDIRGKTREEFLCEIKCKIDELWANRVKVREDLSEKTKIARKQALPYGKLIKKLLDEEN